LNRPANSRKCGCLTIPGHGNPMRTDLTTRADGVTQTEWFVPIPTRPSPPREAARAAPGRARSLLRPGRGPGPRPTAGGRRGGVVQVAAGRAERRRRGRLTGEPASGLVRLQARPADPGRAFIRARRGAVTAGPPAVRCRPGAFVPAWRQRRSPTTPGGDSRWRAYPPDVEWSSAMRAGGRSERPRLAHARILRGD
jgi:hypothetical protein